MNEAIIPRRFCTSCQAHREEATGVYKIHSKTKRWVCRLCIERKSPSIYRNTSGRPADVARIMGRLR
jgi:hypothetical protein